jgi:hypothetical protein
LFKGNYGEGGEIGIAILKSVRYTQSRDNKGLKPLVHLPYPTEKRYRFIRTVLERDTLEKTINLKIIYEN